MELTCQLIQVRYIGVLYSMYVYKDNKSRPILINHYRDSTAMPCMFPHLRFVYFF